MYGVWLAAALASVASGAYRIDAPVIKVGMFRNDVDRAINGYGPFSVRKYQNGLTGAAYQRVDYLGGMERWGVMFDANDLVKSFVVRYYPFRYQPPCLERVWEAFSPPEK